MPVIEPAAAVNDGTGVRIQSVSLGSPAAPSATAVLAAVTDDGSEQTITSGITAPDVPRVISATSGGTAADIGAIQVAITGTDASGATITETLPVFTANSATTVTGAKAFATVTQVVIPAHDGTGATTSIGYGAALGLGAHLARNTVLAAFHDGALETTAPTVATSASALSSNTVTLDTTLDGSAVIVDYYQS